MQKTVVHSSSAWLDFTIKRGNSFTVKNPILTVSASRAERGGSELTPYSVFHSSLRLGFSKKKASGKTAIFKGKSWTPSQSLTWPEKQGKAMITVLCLTSRVLNLFSSVELVSDLQSTSERPVFETCNQALALPITSCVTLNR